MADDTQEVDNDEYACEFCSYGGAPTVLYPGYGTSPDIRLCDVCANSFAGNVARYKSQYSHDAFVITRIMSQQTNYLLGKMGLL